MGIPSNVLLVWRLSMKGRSQEPGARNQDAGARS
jgi:hypothetical protein